MNQKEHLGSSRVFDKSHECSANHQMFSTESQTPQPPRPSQRKKQTRRRRILTTRIIPEDLLDMERTRREIANAIRFHRTSMKQNSYNHQQPPHQTCSGSSFQATPQPQHELKSKTRRNPKIYDSNTTLNFTNNLNTLSYQSVHNQTPQTSHSWPSPWWPLCASAPPPIPETLNLLLPNQTLGLKLNLQEFDDLDITPFQNNYIPAPCYSSTSPSTSNSPLLSVAREETPYVGLSQAPFVENPVVEEDLGLHQVMDAEEMAEIRSVGEQYQSVWDDAMNTVTSTWWFNFLDTMENNTNRVDMDFAPWLITNDNGLQQLDEHYSRDYSQDQTLRQMDIGEIEGMEIEGMMENGWDKKE